MKKGLVLLMAVAMVFAFTSIALAKGDITPSTYTMPFQGDGVNNAASEGYFEQGVGLTSYPVYSGKSSTHPYGTWNSPYTNGIDGYNYNDPQDYVATGTQVDTDTGSPKFTSGPHGGYKTSTHRCRECHAVHRAAGKFKLLRSDTRFEACDWCHGTGAGSGFNIQMDNDDNYTKEFNVGHTMGFGVSEGKWKAPDDTYPAFTPNYWMGGFSCFDCHSPHANPMRLLGYNDVGQAIGLPGATGTARAGKIYGIANPGHDEVYNDLTRQQSEGVVYLSGSWLLVKDADREIAVTNEHVSFWNLRDQVIGYDDLVAGQEISDKYAAYEDAPGHLAAGAFGQYGSAMGKSVNLSTAFDGLYDDTSAGTLKPYNQNKYPVNKIAVNWNTPIGPQSSWTDGAVGFTKINSAKAIWNVSEFCTDCHDGNAGLHTIQAPLFSEDRALRNQDATTQTGGSYDLAYGHDAAPRH